MSEFLTSAQMRAIEDGQISAGHVSGAALMERAGRAVVQAIAAQGRGPGRARVLCGPGNNGGDGFVIARLLQQAGWQVSAEFWGDAARLPADARRMHDLWAKVGPIHPLGAGGRADLVVDALYGTGLSRPLPEPVIAALKGVDAGAVVAVDIPSGLDADGGAILGHVLRADLTVTFHRAKPGHIFGAGPALCGQLQVADIGLSRAPLPPDVLRAVAPRSQDVAKSQGHKYAHGHALVLAGAQGGAARLAARAALRSGAGVVTLACPPEARADHAARLDAVMLRGWDDIDALLADARLSAVCIGPGFGLQEKALLAKALRMDPRPAQGLAPRVRVLDADALTLLARDAGLRADLDASCILTPHHGEFARLFPDLTAESPPDAARKAAVRMGAVVLLKGPATVIAAPDGRAKVNVALGARAVPWLATAGAGDVLAGIIAGLAARGLAPFDAACTGAWLHTEAARLFGPGLIAEDLPEMLPAVFRNLLS